MQKEGYRSNLTLQTRLATLMHILARDKLTEDLAHLKQIEAWLDCGGKENDRPRIEQRGGVGTLLHSFKTLFSALSINFDNDTGAWTCSKGEHTYQLSDMSDGEKQVFCLLADVLVLCPITPPLVVVDEPELNLHPGLAMNLWDMIEQKLDTSVFVYATHSLSFAMRQNVSDIVILGSSRDAPIHITSTQNIPEEELGPFLGSIPAIVTSQKVLVVEGASDKAFDREFYRWAIGPDVAISNVGSCDRVRAAINHEGVWKKAGTAALAGVVDRDYRTESRLELFRTDGCIVLPYHEAESYLVYPQLLVDAARHSGHTLSSADATERLSTLCENRLIDVALKRAIARSEIRLSIGAIGRESAFRNFSEAKDALARWIQSESPRATSFEGRAMEVLEEEHALCKLAIATRDVSKMLELFPGKWLLQPMASFAGFGNTDRLLKSVCRFLRVDDYDPLVEVRKSIRDKLS